MKKRITVILCCCILLFGITACSKEKSTDATNSSSADSQVSADTGSDSGKADTFFKTFSDGTYHMKTKINAADGVETITESYAKDGKMATITTTKGTLNRIVIRDKKMHIILDPIKTIMISDIGVDKALTTQTLETAGMSYVGSGTAEFNGKNLPYEEYKTETGDKVQYFLTNNTLVGMRSIMSTGQTADVIVIALDKNVPDTVFDLPSGYKQIKQ